jgi:hypothetical protein
MNTELTNLCERLDAICQPYGCQKKEIDARDIETIRKAKSELGFLSDKIEQARKRLDGAPNMMLESVRYILGNEPLSDRLRHLRDGHPAEPPVVKVRKTG